MTPPPLRASARPSRGHGQPSGRKGWAVGLVAILLAVGCSSDKASDRKSTAKPRTVTVFAAASLQRAFTAEAKAFEAEHKGVRVALSFAGSQALVEQIQQGAPADVLATADQATMAKVAHELVGSSVVFAHNQLAIVTAKDNPKRVRTLQDLARKDLLVVLAGPTVPVGKAAAKALAAAGVKVSPASLEDSVSGVVTKVGLGEADAGIAYVTDLTAPDVQGIPLPGTTTSLAIGRLSEGDATAFVAFVRSAAGRRILMAFGFQ